MCLKLCSIFCGIKTLCRQSPWSASAQWRCLQEIQQSSSLNSSMMWLDTGAQGLCSS
uniref:Uncharacterized protein n=1 Tax=Anguilla anguilla TaxID=7936 RepID=A0A0E9WNQ4_ANGAN